MEIGVDAFVLTASLYIFVARVRVWEIETTQWPSKVDQPYKAYIDWCNP